MAQLRTRPHPVATVIALVVLGPFILAGALLILAIYALLAVVLLASGNTEHWRLHR